MRAAATRKTRAAALVAAPWKAKAVDGQRPERRWRRRRRCGEDKMRAIGRDALVTEGDGTEADGAWGERKQGANAKLTGKGGERRA